MKTIVLTGGGSAGHVTPNLALIPKLKEAGWNIEYIGSETGIERQIIEKAGVRYHPIASGKLRRYFDLQNFKDPLKVLKGLGQSYLLLKKLKPRVVFSKGGFVSVPVVFGSWLNRIPVIVHESDITPGLANRLAVPFSTKVCVTFPEALKHFPAGKAVHTGTPIRDEILQGAGDRGYSLCGFTRGKPVLLVMGGSLGSEKINQIVRANLDQLLTRFQIVHICGKGHLAEPIAHLKGYKQFEYLHSELPDILAITDLVISRAGANSISEFLALKKPMILIPLTRQQSRGDQILNARSFEKMGFSKVLYEEQLPDIQFPELISRTYDERQIYVDKMKQHPSQNSTDQIFKLIEKVARSK